MGPAISSAHRFDNYLIQYTENGLLVFNQDAPSESQRFLLAPLGLQLNVEEPGVSPPQSTNAYFINGHVIHPDFVAIYDRLGGQQVIGRPLTEARYNPEKGRTEQYFENVGFYRLDNDPQGAVKLLAYGAFVCDFDCRYQPQSSALPIRQGSVSEPFASSVKRLSPSFVGRAISEPYFAQDGNLELIFDNLVMYADANSPSGVSIRPMVEMLAFEPHPLVRPILDDRMLFYRYDGDWGHNIPTVFMNYLGQHGGIEIAGPPITEVFEHKQDIWRQCFTNLCLDYHTADMEEYRVRPAPLGVAFKAEYYALDMAKSFDKLTEKVWEASALISSTERQVISVAVFESDQPLKNVEPTLAITYPDGREMELRMQPTGADGISQMTLKPIVAPNGTLVPYRVCVRDPDGDPFCVDDSFAIWGNP